MNTIKGIIDFMCNFVCKEHIVLKEKRLCPNKRLFFTTYRLSNGEKFMECNYQKCNICLKDNKECEFYSLYTQKPKQSIFRIISNLTLLAFALYGAYCLYKLLVT